jgi:hypothetical protein
MNIPARLVGIGLLGVVAAAACASGGDQSLVSPKQPHAIISTAMPVAPSSYPVKIVWLDGNYLSTPRSRDTFWVAPGKHQIGFRAIINPNRGPSVLVSPATGGQSEMKTLTLDLKQGSTYYFAAKVPNGNVGQWQPVLFLQQQSTQ